MDILDHVSVWVFMHINVCIYVCVCVCVCVYYLNKSKAQVAQTQWGVKCKVSQFMHEKVIKIF
jgi:hypothetical protein